MQISKQNLLPIIANFGIGFFFLSVLSFKGGHNVAPIFLIVLGVGYCIYALIKRIKWDLSKEDKWLICSYIFYFSVFALSLLVNGGKGRELDNPSRVILLIPALLLLFRIPLKQQMLLYVIPLGSVIAGAMAIYDKFILNQEMAYAIRTMQIQGGDIAMSFALFSLVIAFYFWQKRKPMNTVLCFVASLFGVLGSILSTARGGWVALPIMLVVLLWVYRDSLSKKFIFSLIGIFTIAVVGISQMPNSRVMERLSRVQSDIAHYEQNRANTSLGARFEMWKSALLMAKEKPILGWGDTGATEKRKQDSRNKVVLANIGQFNHAHNQYLDDLSKRGIVGLLALLGILLVPLRYFMQRIKHSSSEVKLMATLGVTHIISVMIYCLSQGFFTHNSGNIFYFFLTVVFYAMLKQAENTQYLENA